MPKLHFPLDLSGHLLDAMTLLFLAGLSFVFVFQMLAKLFWWPELFTHFYLQYFLLSLVGAFICLIRYRAYRLTVSVILIMLFAAQLLPYYYQNRAVAINQHQTELTLLFSNFNYGNTNYAALQKVVEANHPDLVAVVELPEKHFEDLKPFLPDYPFTYQQQDRDHQGIAVFSRLAFGSSPETFWPTGNAFPLISFKLQQDTAQPPIQFLIIHPPPPLTSKAAMNRNNTFNWLAKYVSTITSPIVVAGDFNSTSWSPEFIKLLSQTHLRDSRANNGLQPSWPSQLPKLLRIPIDHVLISSQISVLDRQIMPTVGSDHLPVLVKLGY